MTSVTVSAPGSIMITGEHAVVYGHKAIVCAIDQRITVQATPLPAPQLEIQSEIAPPLLVDMNNLPSDGPYRFVLRAVSLYRAALPHGLRLTITSHIDPTLGLGSSAAVTIATLAALAHMTDSTPDALHSQALGIVRAVQGRGSGADLAASLKGGMVAYQLPPFMLSGVPEKTHQADIATLPTPDTPLSLRYAGYKTPTAQVLAKIAAAMKNNEEIYSKLYDRMGRRAQAAITAAHSGDWGAFSEHLTSYQSLMEQLGVSDEVLDQIITQARTNPGTLAAKISGSGLGDCVVALGAVPPGFTPAPIAMKGVLIHD